MILKNGFVLDKSFRFIKADVLVENGKIKHIGEFARATMLLTAQASM